MNAEGRVFHGVFINGLFKTIFKIKLSTQRLYLHQDLNHEDAQHSLPRVTDEHLFKTIFPVNYPTDSKDFYPGDP